MPKRRLLLLDANRMSAFTWSGGNLVVDGEFAGDPVGLEAFAQYLHKGRNAIYSLLADVAEEGFQVEDVPYVQGSDRAALTKRRLGQYFYGTPLATAISLGRQRDGRRDEKMLFAALTRPQHFEPWLTALRESEAAFAGLYAMPLVQGEFAKTLGRSEKHLLLLTLGKGGLRQTYFENGQFRFSRQITLVTSSIDEYALACATEAEKVHQYLVGQRLIERSSRLTTLVLVHPAEIDHVRRELPGTGSILFEFLDLDAEARKRGLKLALRDSISDPLFLHLLARRPPAQQLAPPEERHHYRVWQVRSAINATALGGFVACMVLAAKFASGVYVLQDQTAQVRQATAADTQRYEAMLKTLPQIPIKVDDLRSLTDRFNELEKRSPQMADTFRRISLAMDASPAIEIKQLKWRLANKVTDLPGAATGQSQAPAPIASQTKPTVATVDGNYFAIVDLEAQLPPSLLSDHRKLLATVDGFVLELRKDANLDVKVTRLPFDTESGKTIRSSGETTAAKAEAPIFTMRVAQRIF
ncbi:MAG TPA: hypothetical protein VI279_13215 [Rhodocyclaceae bacterium]